MKMNLSAIALAFSMTAFAAEQTSNLEDQKTITNNALDAIVSRMEQDRPCVQKSQSIDELKACRTKLRADLNAMGEDIVSTRKEIKKYHEGKKSL